MATILEENRKTLRQAMVVECGFRETSDEPTSITASNDVQNLEALANLGRGVIPPLLMDLAGDGFLNDGNAIPMETDSDVYRYGYMSSEVAKADGTFDNPLTLVITAATSWDVITLEVCGPYNDSRILQLSPVWIGGQTTVTIDTWTPGSRVYVTGIYLGLAWVWNNDKLISVSADLHGVGTEIGGELEVSSIEIQAYEPTDYTDRLGRIPKGAPIWYSAGYPGDMSTRRDFYMSEDASWNDNVLTVKGQDASMLLDNVEVPVSITAWGSDYSVGTSIIPRVRSALSSINYDEIGSTPSIGLSQTDVLFEAKAARSIISEYTGIFRDENGLRLTYVDAGIPTLWKGPNGSTWTIYADEIADLDVTVEQVKNELKMVLADYYSQWNSAIETIEATAGKTYFVDLDPPVPPANVHISPTPTSSEEINPSVFKFKAAATTTYTISGNEEFENLQDANNPYVSNASGSGESYIFDFSMMPFDMVGGGSLTKDAIDALFNRSNILFEFTYRGNPHIQPRDVLNVEIARWEDVYEVVDGLYPALDLYPRTDLYPYGIYKKVRKMVKTWETMTVDTITLEHGEDGGLSSKIKARKGAV